MSTSASSSSPASPSKRISRMPVLAETPLQAPDLSDLKHRDLQTSFEPKRLLDQQRSEANKRERQRVQNITHAYEDLLEMTPKDSAEPKLARIEIVRRAAGYIGYLTDFLQQIEAAEALAHGPVVDPNVDLSPPAMRHSFMEYEYGDTVQRLDRKRVVCNSRARVRCRGTKAAFDSLKQSIPVHDTEPELSRLSILRRATDYIAFMTLLLREDDDCEQEGQESEGTDASKDSPPKGKHGAATLQQTSLPRPDSEATPATQPEDINKQTEERQGSERSLEQFARLPTDFSLLLSSESPTVVDSDYFSIANSTPTSTLSNSTTFNFDCVPSASSSSDYSCHSEEPLHTSPASWLSAELDDLLTADYKAANETSTSQGTELRDLSSTLPLSHLGYSIPTAPLAHATRSAFAAPVSSRSAYQPTLSTATVSSPTLPTGHPTFCTLTATSSLVSDPNSFRCERESLAPSALPATQLHLAPTRDDLWHPRQSRGRSSAPYAAGGHTENRQRQSRRLNLYDTITYNATSTMLAY